MSTSKLMPNIEAEVTLINPGLIKEDHIHVVAAVIWNQSRDQFLIAKRPKGKHLENYWEFPGGKLESGESPLQALKRELQEEISIVVTDAEPFMQVYHRYPERNILLDTWVVSTFQGSVEAREQQLLDWINLDQIKQYLFPPADVPILDALKMVAD
jgi:8-oxo-dGTP diphosphatase